MTMFRLKALDQREAIISAAMDAIVLLDHEQQVILLNPAAERMFGVSAASVMGSSVGCFIPERFRDTHVPYLAQFSRREPGAALLSRRAEMIGLRANGQEFPVEASISQIVIAGENQFAVFLRDITERKEAEAALRQSEERLRVFIASAPAAIAMFDRQMCYLAASERWLKLFSLEDNIMGASHYNDMPMPPAWKEAHQRGLAGEVVSCEEESWVRPDGQQTWTRWEVRPWHAAGGMVGGLVIFVEDISPWKKAEASLRESQEREEARRRELEAVMEANPMPVLIARDPECRQITGNQAGQKMLRLPAGANLSRTAPEAERPNYVVFSKGEAIPETELPMQLTGRTGKPVLDQEWEIRFHDGTSRWVYGNAVPLLEENGSVRGVVGTFVDVTERKRVEEALAKSNARFDGIISSAMDAIISVDARQHIVLFNPAAERMFGVSAAVALGQDLNRFIPERFGGAHTRSVEQFGKNGHSPRIMGGLSAVSGLRANGQEFPIEASISQVEVKGEKLFTVILRDITERGRAEAELRISREQLRALAARLQAVREEERTRLAREFHDGLAQDLTRLKMDISWLNRRLNTPQDAAQKLLLQEKLAAMAELTDTAMTSVQRIATELRPVVLDSLGLCAAIEWQARDFEQRTGIVCKVALPGQDLALERDRATAVFRILQESLANVARHAAATGVEIHLQWEPRQITLIVRDNGRGIAPGELEAPHSVGLLGMRERAALLGGRCHVEGRAGGGTTVQACLPLPVAALPGKP